MKQTRVGLLAIIGIAALLVAPSPASAQITLGSAQSFAVLGGTTVTNTGPSVITGNVGVSPGTAVTGFGPGGATIVGGAIHAADAVAGQARTDLAAAFLAIEGTPCNVDLTGQDLGGLTLTPGVYCFSSSAGLTGTLTLDFQGDANALFLFRIGSTLITASGSNVVLINNALSTCPPNLFWRVGSSATLATGSSFTGNILAQASITLTTGAQLNGRALAHDGAVTLDTNTVTLCAPAIVCPIITVNPATLPNGTVGSLYAATVSATDGSPGETYTFARTSGTLPPGLTLNATTGAITGLPNTPGTFNFTVTATDTVSGCLGSRAYTVVIAATGCAYTITLTPPPLPPGVIGATYSRTISATGGTGAVAFSVVGSLPTGLTLNPTTGEIRGMPTTAGLFTFTIRATDAASCVGSAPYSITILAAAAPGIPTLDWVGMALLVALIAAAGLFLAGRISS